MPPKRRRKSGEDGEALLARQKQALRLAKETPEQREARLQDGRERDHFRRATEAPEEREARLRYYRERAKMKLATETPEEREARLQSRRYRFARNKSSKTPEQREAHRRKEREKLASMRAQETAEQREERLRQIKEKNDVVRGKETPEAHEARLQRLRKTYAYKRANETPEERALRLRKMREWKAKKRERERALETPEQREARQQATRERNAARQAEAKKVEMMLMMNRKSKIAQPFVALEDPGLHWPGGEGSPRSLFNPGEVKEKASSLEALLMSCVEGKESAVSQRSSPGVQQDGDASVEAKKVEMALMKDGENVAQPPPAAPEVHSLQHVEEKVESSGACHHMSSKALEESVLDGSQTADVRPGRDAAAMASETEVKSDSLPLKETDTNSSEYRLKIVYLMMDIEVQQPPLEEVKREGAPPIFTSEIEVESDSSQSTDTDIEDPLHRDFGAKNHAEVFKPNGLFCKVPPVQENSSEGKENESSKLHTVLNECRSSADFKSNKECGELVKKLDEVINPTKRLLSQTETIRNKIHNLFKAKKFLFTTPIDDVKLHPEYSEFCHNAQNTTTSEMCGDGLEIVNVVSTAKKINLPPAGDIKRQPLVAGLKVWVMKTSLTEIFIKGEISSIFDSNDGKLYRIRFENSNYESSTLYNSKQLAYRSPPDVILTVGTRIIARYLMTGIRAGVVGEPPTATNKHRYLVFFDDGCVSYVSHNEVYLMCFQSADVANDVHDTISNFIRDYLLKYPERALVRLQIGQNVKTEFGSKWCSTKVIELDASMARMKYLDGSSRTEWIFRGSIRIEPLFNELKSAQEHSLTGGRQRKHNITVRKPNRPYVEYTVNVDSESDPENKTREKSENSESSDESHKKSKNTARKSTSMKPRKPEFEQRRTRFPDIKSHLGFKELHNLVTFTRTEYKAHNCSYLCKETMDPSVFKGKNPFLIPIYMGWERQLRKFNKSGQKLIVMYRAPCGKHLRNLKEVYEYLILVSSKITIDFFSDDNNLVAFRTFRPREIFFKTDDITQGKETVPISCINSWSNEKPPHVEYASKRFPGEGVNINVEEEFLTGCTCTDNCQNSDSCECRQITNYAGLATYHGNIGYKFKRLKEPVLTGIFECNSKCKCGPQCGNRVVQNGIQVRLQMFKTENKGWGIRCLDDLDAGMFICIYAGKLLTDEGADAGGNQYGDEYLAELDHIEIAERTKEGYESDVMDMEEDKNGSDKDSKESGSEDNYKNMDSESEDSDSDFESTLRNTAVTNYTTRSRKRKHSKSDLNSNIDIPPAPADKLSKLLPELSSSLDSFPIIPRPLSPESELYVDKTQLIRIPNLTGFEKLSPAKTTIERNGSTKPKFRSIRSFFGKGGDRVFIMDAKTKGNIGRYLNHSCVPNVFVQNVFVETHDLRFPEVAFFAYHFIQAGTELTWDYNYEVGSVQNKKMYCYCDARNCRGRLL